MQNRSNFYVARLRQTIFSAMYNTWESDRQTNSAKIILFGFRCVRQSYENARGLWRSRIKFRSFHQEFWSAATSFFFCTTNIPDLHALLLRKILKFILHFYKFENEPSFLLLVINCKLIRFNLASLTAGTRSLLTWSVATLSLALARFSVSSHCSSTCRSSSRCSHSGLPLFASSWTR